LADLSQDKDSKKARKDKIKQRAPFRDIQRSVLEGEVPAGKTEINRMKIRIDRKKIMNKNTFWKYIMNN